MRAMILAAGFGTRLLPLTSDIPKALIPISGTPLLGMLLNKLKMSGFTEIAVNAHYKAEMVEKYIAEWKDNSQVRIKCVYEDEILNTGGGIKNMLSLFNDNDPILVQNVDILCDISYPALFTYHNEQNADCTLVVNSQNTSRPLGFNTDMNFAGRTALPTQHGINAYNFCGIQVIQPDIFNNTTERTFYSIDAYIQAMRNGGRIKGYDLGDTYWRDLGTVRDLKQAERDISLGLLNH